MWIFILTSIRFGKQLTEDELKEIKAVVKARIAAFSRDDAEIGYTTLIECEIDPMDKPRFKFGHTNWLLKSKGKRQRSLSNC
jgi:hypothetical protein